MNIESSSFNRFFDYALRAALRRRPEHAEGMTVLIRVNLCQKKKEEERKCVYWCSFVVSSAKQTQFELYRRDRRVIPIHPQEFVSSRLCG